MRLFIFLLYGLILVSCASPDEKGQKIEQVGIKIVSEETLASDLQVPWNIIKQEDSFFITERTGHITVVDSEGHVQREPLYVKQPIRHQGEGGLLGMELHPDFNNNQLAYVYYTYLEGSRIYNRIALVERVDNEWHEIDSILDGIRGAQFHNGGRIKLGPDGYLYATAGDIYNDYLAQNVEELIGSILRMDLDGGIPEDNPFPNSYIYSYGHRNPQGLTWDELGNLFSSEHGPVGFDEINHIIPGHNYGWPDIRGDEIQTGMEAPLFHSGDDTWAPSGMVYYEGILYVAGLRGEGVFAFDLHNDTVEKIYEGIGRIRDIYIDSNRMYLITNNTDGRGNPVPEDDRLIVLTFE